MKMKTLFNKKMLAATMMAATLAAAVPAMAKVPPAQADRLGKDLTPVGAEKAGSKDGTIPAWDGGMTTPPACYKGGSFLCNPYPDDKPLFTITAKNMDKYKDHLTPGEIAMLQKYPDTYFMPVYKTRRNISFPKYEVDMTKKNALETETLGVTGLKNLNLQGYPFPIPQNGLEVIWNHITRYRGNSLDRRVGQVTPLVNGDYSMVMFHDQFSMRNRLTDIQPGEDQNIMFFFKEQVTAPARLAGNVLLVHETIDQVKEPRQAWIYNAGQRRVRRAPQVAYDGPGTAADGMRTADNFDLYNGSPDRYDWKLEGKQEIYIPYDNYMLAKKGLKYDDIIKPGHLNQSLTRYELHRVWKVVATLRPGMRHIYAKRVFFIDEDSWQIGEIDHYDGRGNLWRVAEAFSMFFYNAQVFSYALETLYDLNASRYLALGFNTEESQGVEWNVPFSKADFEPNALRRSGIR